MAFRSNLLLLDFEYRRFTQLKQSVSEDASASVLRCGKELYQVDPLEIPSLRQMQIQTISLTNS